MHQHLCCLVITLAILGCIVPDVDAGYCYKSKRCSRTCYRSTKYSTDCGNWWAGPCTKYRSRSYTCYTTCYVKECCPGYGGANCESPLCNGETSCPNGGTCTSPDVCSCRPGFTGSACADIDECSTDLHQCEQLCSNTHGSYTCQCKPGYILDEEKFGCLDINECSTGQHDCEQDCTNTLGSYTCMCGQGFQTQDNGKTCIDIDECATSNGQCSDKCTNSHGSYFCSCDAGYQLDTDSRTCIDINECSIDNGGCDGVCFNTYGSYTCDCEQGYELTQDGSDDCQDIDECESGVSGCAHFCDNTEGSYSCSCRPGYTLAEDLHSCLDEDDCIGADCHNGGLCVDQVGGYTCSCSAGFQGNKCEDDVDECRILNGGCEDVCVNTFGSYKCECSGDSVLHENGKTCSGTEDTYTVFQEFGILGERLPRGCAVLSVQTCPGLSLTSTSPWYQLQTDTTVHYTFGIVFVELAGVALPVSVTGAEIKNTEDSFEMSVAVAKYTQDDGVMLDVQKDDGCMMVDFTSKQLYDFVNANSFLKTMLSHLYDILPDWLQISENGTKAISVQDLKSDLVYGDTRNSLYECKGAPVKSDHLYNVFRFGTDFYIKVYEEVINLPEPVDGNRFCLMVDLCQGHGMTVILMLPPESRHLLDELRPFKLLTEKYGTRIRPRGIGFSLDKGIATSPDVSSLELWNGERVFKYLNFQDSNVWLGADLEMVMDTQIMDTFGFQFEFSANMDLYLGTPSISTLLSGMFIDEWSLFGQIQDFNIYPTIKFDVFGFNVDMKMKSILSATLNTVASLGGLHERAFCGEMANPEGVYMSFLMDFNLFRGIPILEDWVLSGKTDVKAFFATDHGTNSISNAVIDLSAHLINIRDTAQKAKLLITNKLDEIEQTVSEVLMQAYTEVLKKMDDFVEFANGLTNLPDLQYLLQSAVEIMESFWELFSFIRKSAQYLFEVLQLESTKLFNDVTQIITEEVNRIGTAVQGIASHVNEEVMTKLNHYSGFGLRLTLSVNILGLSFPKGEVEIVHSVDRLLQCSRFEQFNDLLENEPSLKILVGISGYVKVGQFITLKRGFHSLSASYKSYKFVYHLQAVFDVLGMTVVADAYITTKGFAATLQGNIWNAFYAHIDLYAGLDKSWHDLLFNVNGVLVAGSSEGPDFSASYLDALLNIGSSIAESANRRLTAVQDSLTRAQNSLRSVQDWFSKCQNALRETQAAYEKAITEGLETAKKKVEEAKQPYEDALEKLRIAQKDVDNLCKIRSCGSVCIPGLRSATCRRGWFKWPCLKKTSCMIRLTDPVCEIKNLACRAYRGLAFLALEAAKIFVRIPMLAYDAAIATLTVAQHAVELSRVMFVAAEAVLETAKIGVEAAIGVFEAAKAAIELVKHVVRAALEMFDFIIQYGLKKLIDIRNCGFELQLSTADRSMFEVFCEVNPLQRGWGTMKFTIDFRNPLNTLWYAAKSTIGFVVKLLEGVIDGRKRRAISFLVMGKAHKILKRSGTMNDTNFDFDLNTIDAKYNSNWTNASVETPLFRMEMFKERCNRFTRVHNFLQLSVTTLFDMTNESVNSIESAGTILEEIDAIDGNFSDFDYTTDTLEINEDAAFMDYNLTEDDLATTLNEIKTSTENDSLLQDIRNSTSLAKDMIDSDIKTSEQVSLLDFWIVGMENDTHDQFDETECTGFEDCVIYAFSVLYELFMDDFLPGNGDYRNSTLDLEEQFVIALNNQTKTIIELYNISTYLLDKLTELEEKQLLCSTPPEILSNPIKKTLLYGSSIAIPCETSSQPGAMLTWFHNDEMIPVVGAEILELNNVTIADNGAYKCIAGNVVTNVSSGESYIDVKECTPGTYFDLLECVECERGFYQPDMNKETCIPCPVGSTTTNVGASMETECIDINECIDETSSCQHICINTIGSYMCDCHDQHVLLDDGQACKEEGRAGNAGLIAGSSIAAVVLLLILGLGVWMYKFKSVKPLKVRPGAVSRSNTHGTLEADSNNTVAKKEA